MTYLKFSEWICCRVEASKKTVKLLLDKAMYKQVRNTEIDYEHDTTYYDYQIF